MTKCECGCGEETKAGNRFIFNHHKRGCISHNKGKTKKNYEPLKRAEKTFKANYKGNGQKWFEEHKNDIIYCKCNCGQKIKIELHHKYDGIPKYINGHQGIKRPCLKETRKLIGEANTGKIPPNKNMTHIDYYGKEKAEKIGKKISIKAIIRLKDLKEIKKLSKIQLKSYKENPERAKKQSKTMKKGYASGRIKLNNGCFKPGHKVSEKNKKACSIRLTKQNKDPEFIKKRMKGILKRPTSYEQTIMNLIKKHNLPYKYTGDWSFTIGRKNPDFVNTNGKKIAIEVFYDYFKIQDYGSVNNYKKERSKIFKEYGWKTIFIGDDLINNEQLILSKIINI